MSQREVTRKEIADAFRYARFLLNTGEARYICHALDHVTDHSVRDRCKEIIRVRMETSPDATTPSLEQWLCMQGYFPEYENARCRTPETIAYRFRWLNSLIEEFSHE